MSEIARLEGRTILLTGGAGFIGSTLARRLLPDNRVVVLDTGARNSLASSGVADHPNLKVIIGDVLDPVAVREAMRGCTIVVHLAAIAGVDTVIKMPVTTMKVNMIGTYNVLEAAVAQGGMERFVDFSTSEVFGSYAYKVSVGDVT
jgi:nucleoside-diphosphate-sugar epimerase